jgi:hypothetical protein
MLENPVLMVGAIVSSIVAVATALRSIYKLTRKVDDAIGTDLKGRTIVSRLDRVEHQLWENGGDSLADRVNKLSDCAHETAVEVKFIKDVLLTMLGQQVKEEAAKPAPKARTRKTA